MNHLRLYEDFLDKKEVTDWLHSNGILKSKDFIDPIELVKYFTIKNPDLIKLTALGNCHALGLNSFILNQSPKIRLFVCDDNSELHQPFDPGNPIIPIHPHKYDDLFFQVSGKLIHHLYKKDISGIEFNKYNFIRLNDRGTEIKNLGKETLKYIGEFNNINKLKAKALHTASVQGKCSWIIIETKKDETFSEILYHQDLKPRPELYTKINDPIGFINQFLKGLII